MAGSSSRFKSAGYDKPKFMLEAHGKTLFELSVGSFKDFFQSNRFIFICRQTHAAVDFIEEKSRELGILNFQIVELEYETNGQAETVLIGLNKLNLADNSPLVIFNIDTIRKNFRFLESFTYVDGYLEVFNGEGDHWSFVEQLSDTNRVLRTTEKERISEWCSNGFYYFRSFGLFKSAFGNLSKTGAGAKKEFYVAPMYNFLIKLGKDVRFEVVDIADLVFCGIPEEYIEFINSES